MLKEDKEVKELFNAGSDKRHCYRTDLTQFLRSGHFGIMHNGKMEEDWLT